MKVLRSCSSRSRRLPIFGPSFVVVFAWLFVMDTSHMLPMLPRTTTTTMVVQAYTPPLEIFAFKFFDSTTGESVAMKGIDYYPRPNAGELNNNNIDFYHDEYTHIWSRDIPIFKELGVNAIRLYGVDPGKNHDTFMCALQEAGIYVMIGLAADCEDCSISAVQSPNCYHPALKSRGQYIINIFAKYDNVLAFEAGNEVGLVADAGPEWNAACQKKFLQDMRTYIAACSDQLGMRPIPVGVVIADVDRVESTDYYNCQTDPDDEYERAEWMGLNAYQHCDGTVTDSDNAIGYQNLKLDFDDYSIPLLLTEYGCLNESFEDEDGFENQRTFDQARWMFEEDFRDTLAGGFAFEYSVERQNSLVPFPFQQFGDGNFGIGYFASEFCTDNPNNTSEWCRYLKKPEFTNLQTQYAATQHVGVENRATFQPPANRQGASVCPAGWPSILNYTWETDAEPDLWCTDAVKFTCVNVIVPDNNSTTSTNTNSTRPPSPTTEPGGGGDGDDGGNLISNVTKGPATAPTSDVPSSVPTMTPSPTITAKPTSNSTLSPTTLPTSVNLTTDNDETSNGGGGTGTGTGGSTSMRLKNFRVTLSGEEPNDVAFKNTMLAYLSDDFTTAFPGSFLFMRLDVLRSSRQIRTRRTQSAAAAAAGVVVEREKQQEELHRHQLISEKDDNDQGQRRQRQRDLQEEKLILFEIDFFGTATFKDDSANANANSSAPTNAQVEQQQTVSLSNRTAIEAAMAVNPDIDDDIVLERVEYIEAQVSRAPTPAPPPVASGAATARAAMTARLLSIAVPSLVLLIL